MVFDGEHENSRHTISPDYKANRIDYSTVSIDKNPYSQLMDVYTALDYLSIKHTETTDCVADDLIASYAFSFGQYADFKSLTGDAADNIKKESIKTSVIENTEKLKKNYKMIKLENTLELPYRLQELKYCYTEIATNEVLKSIGLKR